MKQWWERNKAVLGDYTKDEVEDSTGCIPLLLDECIVKDEKGQPFMVNLCTSFFNKIYDQALTFEQEILSKCKYKMAELNRYSTLVLPPRRC